MENYFHQEIVVFEDDTLIIEFPLEVVEFNNAFNVSSTDNAWFGVSSTPGGSYILQIASFNWDQGILGGNASSFITQTITNGTPGNYSVGVSSVSPAGGNGAILSLQINALGNINTSVFEFTEGGGNYSPGDVLTFNAALFGSDQDLKVTLDSSIFPTIPQPGSSRIKIVAPQGANGPATVKVQILDDDFQASSGPLVTGNKYYWELVVGEYKSYTISNFDSQTQVSAAGTLIISGSMFSNAGLRPS